MEAQGEKLLQDLVSQEQTLIGKVEDAKRQAEQIVQEAQEEASQIKAKARQEADKKAEEQREEARAKSEETRQEALARAKREVETLESQAEQNKGEAVELVMEQVLP